ncbi:hypothetical protein [Dendronalium sp. ChiSLP03b]|uniref:hypothetical protein n=1 Tax=Dendronalium sp. ChiSLP03b TaxID=3075381 RepID=UPI002AD3F01A|nr:hypothetical protein [Dendronalium sp. ChiSLP03b]MDZ8204391.1 hypothetical protein [Dendronalium sp. ChiSLP03b]
MGQTTAVLTLRVFQSLIEEPGHLLPCGFSVRASGDLGEGVQADGTSFKSGDRMEYLGNSFNAMAPQDRAGSSCRARLQVAQRTVPQTPLPHH